MGKPSTTNQRRSLLMRMLARYAGQMADRLDKAPEEDGD